MMILFLVCLIGVVVVSFFCSLCEAAFMSLNTIRAETLKEEGGRNAGQVFDLKRNLGRTVVAILILNTLANTGGATLTGGAFAACAFSIFKFGLRPASVDDGANQPDIFGQGTCLGYMPRQNERCVRAEGCGEHCGGAPHTRGRNSQVCSGKTMKYRTDPGTGNNN